MSVRCKSLQIKSNLPLQFSHILVLNLRHFHSTAIFPGTYRVTVLLCFDWIKLYCSYYLYWSCFPCSVTCQEGATQMQAMRIKLFDLIWDSIYVSKMRKIFIDSHWRWQQLDIVLLAVIILQIWLTKIKSDRGNFWPELPEINSVEIIYFVSLTERDWDVLNKVFWDILRHAALFVFH